MEERNIFAPKKTPFKRPELVDFIAEGNLPALEAELAKGWDIHKKLPVEETYSQAPFEIALYHEQIPPLQAAIYGGSEEIAFLLLENGCRLTPDGTTLRHAAEAGFTHLCEYLIAHGFDVNYCEPDMVYPYNASPLQVAALDGHLALVKRLIELGADLSYKDKYGERAYHYALRNKQKAVAEYIKSVEPAEWHDEEERLQALKAYKLPEGLIALMRATDRRIPLPECEYTSFVEFAPLSDIKEVKWKNRKFLDLLSDADRYGAEGFLVWYPRNKKLAFADYEHETFTELCTFEEFMANPSAQINKIFE